MTRQFGGACFSSYRLVQRHELRTLGHEFINAAHLTKLTNSQEFKLKTPPEPGGFLTMLFWA